MATTDDKQDRRIERLEERVNSAERDVTELSSKLKLINNDLSRRIIDINENLKADAERTRIDLRERIDILRTDLKSDIGKIGTSIDVLDKSISTLNSSLQKLYITQEGSTTKVNINEKIIWAVIGIFITSGLYLLQDLLKASGAG